MKIVLYSVSTAKELWFSELTKLYLEKINHYYKFELLDLKTKKNSRDQSELKKKLDSGLILDQLSSDDYIILFDEKGKSFNSIEFAKKTQIGMDSGKKRLVFIIGGAYGVSDDVKKNANLSVSLSAMTYNHLVAEAVALEQIYRAITINKNIPYHNI